MLLKQVSALFSIPTLAAAAVLACGFSQPAVAVGQIVTFEAPHAGKAAGQGTIVVGINAGGTVAGSFTDRYNIAHSFLRAPDGTFTTFGKDDQGAAVFAINDKGLVAGSYYDFKQRVFQGFLRKSKDKLKPFECLGQRQCNLQAMAMNASVTIAGDYIGEDGNVYAFYRLRDGTLGQIGVPNSTSTFATSINMADAITGQYSDANYVYHGYLRAPDGTITSFDAPDAGGIGTLAAKINKSGWIAGTYVDSTNLAHGFLRDPAGNFTEFEAPDGSAGTGASNGINNHTTVAGVYTDDVGANHGYLRKKDGTFTEFDPPGSTDTEPTDINDSDVVVGYYTDSSGVYHGFLKTP